MFVSWIRHHGRSEGLAAALEVPCHFIATGQRGRRSTVPWRYLVQTIRTIVLLVRTRPHVLYVMAPPLPLVVIGLAYQAATRGTLVVDAHTGAVVHGDGRPKRTFLRLARRARATVVTTDRLATIVTAAGVRAVVVGDPPLASRDVAVAARSTATGGRPQVVWPCSWYRDEPIDAVVAAATQAPDLDVVLTGRPPATFDRAALPANVRLTGWLDDDEYDRLLVGATGVLALTTRELTMQRAGYEALILGRPVIASSTDVLRDYFTSGAVFATADPGSLRSAMEACVRDEPRLAAEMVELRAEKEAEFAAQLRALSSAVA